MSINGWFPKINNIGQIASGDNGIWVDGELHSSKGTSPFWMGNVLGFNRNDGTTQIGNEVIDIAYNEYFGSDKGDWTGFVGKGIGRVDFYNKANKTNVADGICLAKYAGLGDIYGFNLVYVAPYQSELRSLVYNNVLIYQGKVTNYAMSINGIIAWQIATGTYTRQILTGSSIISIRTDENPISVFEYLGQSWIVTQCNAGLLIYPFNSSYGYLLPGDLYYPDSRMIGNKLRIVGSTYKGEPKFDNWIDFTKPRIDLRKI